MQVREGAVDVLQHAVELFLGDRGVGAQRVEESPLAVELLQQVALQVRAARNFQDLEHPREACVVAVGVVLAEEETHPLVEVLEPQQRPDALVEGIFVGDHAAPLDWPGLWGNVRRMTNLSGDHRRATRT